MHLQEDGELGPADLEKVLGRMLLIPRESAMTGGRGGGKMTSRLAMIKGSPEEIDARLTQNIAEWAVEIIKEVDTTGTGTVSYDEWEEAITSCDSFHDFASFAVASKSSIEATQRRMDGLKRKHDKAAHAMKGGTKHKQHKGDNGKGKGKKKKHDNNAIEFKNPLEQVDANLDAILRAEEGAENADLETAEEDLNGNGDEGEGEAGGEEEDSWNESDESWSEKHPASELFDRKPIHLLELVDSEDFTAQLLAMLEPTSVVAGTTIVASGVHCQMMYFIAQGQVSVAKTMEADPFRTLEAGDTFGERAIVSGKKTEAAYVAIGGVKLYVLSAEKLSTLLQNNPEAKKSFLAPIEVRIAAKLRALSEEYTTSIFQGMRPPSLEQRIAFHTDDHAKEEATEEELNDLDALLMVPGTIVKAPFDITESISKKLPENPLWIHSIHAVQAKFGRGVSTTFQLQRWIGEQNLRVALMWLVLVIIPRQYALFRYCDDSIEALFVLEGFTQPSGAVCSSKISGSDFGYIAPDVMVAREQEAAALTTAGGVGGDRVWQFASFSAFAPAMGESFYLRHFAIAYTVSILFIYSTTIRSLFLKMHEVLAGLPVLGSGTESVTGFESKTDGFFSVLSQYDFSIRDATSVASLQDGIYTHLEMLTESRKAKDEQKQTLTDRLRLSFGWVLYGCLVGLCGLCIYMILSEDWIPEQCCACGCSDCADETRLRPVRRSQPAPLVASCHTQSSSGISSARDQRSTVQ